MHSVVVNGKLWSVRRVSPLDPALVDRTGRPRLATTDPVTRTVNLSTGILPPLLDRVVLHEMAHVVAISHGLLDVLDFLVPRENRIAVEEWSAGVIESYGIEALDKASQVLGRPVCVNGSCAYAL